MILVAAVGPNGIIGKKNGSLVWSFPEDLAVFRYVTEGGLCLVGRKTAEHLPKLKGREFLVLSSKAVGPNEVSSIEEAYERGVTHVIGGAQTYLAALPYLSGACVSYVDVPVRSLKDASYVRMPGEILEWLAMQPRIRSLRLDVSEGV